MTANLPQRLLMTAISRSSEVSIYLGRRTVSKSHNKATFSTHMDVKKQT